MGGRVGEAMELLQHPPSSQPIHSKQYIHVHLHFYIPINATHTLYSNKASLMMCDLKLMFIALII